MPKPLCFVLLPPGRESAPAGRTIDFDRVYAALLAPAVEAAGLEPLRADEGHVESLVHSPMFERFVLCEYALVDLTAADANVFYELGVRHAVRSGATALTFAHGRTRLSFDAASIGALAYDVGPDGGPLDAEAARERITARLVQAREPPPATSLFELLEDYRDVAHEKTDVFLERVRMAHRHRQEITRRSKLPPDVALRELCQYERSLGAPADVESAVLVATLLAYRDLQAYGDMIRVVEAMPAPLARTALVREQYALALNRAGRGNAAEAILQDLLATRGASSETCALLGRVYKDRYNAARERGDSVEADKWLGRAAETYLAGFEADTRDDYPGTNAVTLLAIRDRSDPRVGELLPVVRYSARRRVATARAGYWSHAALLELAMLADDEADARVHLGHALAEQPERWKIEATLNNLRLLQGAGAAPAWAETIAEKLTARAAAQQ